jgi:N-dimethylarginine dimethylaminohydrolase
VTRQSEVGRLTRVILKAPREAFESAAAIDAQWRALNFTEAPDLSRAAAEYERFVDLLEGHEVATAFLRDAGGLDSIYVRDASVVCDRGAILCSMGKPNRTGEPSAQAPLYGELGVPLIGAIEPPGLLEGGDAAWIDEHTLAVGRGYRTNDEGIRQLRAILGDAIDVVVVPLPHWRGPGDVFNLMSILSPVDRDLAVVYAPLMPVPFREALMDRGISLVEVPDDEFDTMGANVLAIAPRTCIMLRGNPRTRERLERAGAQVFEYEGQEISVKGGGGPTCLTRPIDRS